MSEADQLLNAEQSGEGVVTQASQTDANLGRYSSSVQASRPLRTQLCTSSRGLLSPHAIASHAHLLLCSLPGAGEVRPVVLQRFIYDPSHTTVGSHHWRYAEGKKLPLKRALFCGPLVECTHTCERVCVPLLRAACLLPSSGRELLVCPAGAQQPQRHKAAFIHLPELLQHVCLLTEEPQQRYRPPPCKSS